MTFVNPGNSPDRSRKHLHIRTIFMIFGKGQFPAIFA
jgi:hypothetical protein